MHIGIEVLNVGLSEVGTTSIELYDFRQRLHPAVVHVGPGQFHISQRRSLEGTVHSHPAIRCDHIQRVNILTQLLTTTVGQRPQSGYRGAHSDVLGRGAYADIVETLVIERDSNCHRHQSHTMTVRLGQDTANRTDSRPGKLRTMMTVDAATFVHEDPQTFLRCCTQCCLVTLCVTIVRSIIGHQSRLIHHDRQAPVQRKIRFHVGVAIRGQFLTIPPLRLERPANQRSISGCVLIQTATAGVPVQSQHAVVLGHLLLSQRTQSQQLPPQLRK